MIYAMQKKRSPGIFLVFFLLALFPPALFLFSGEHTTESSDHALISAENHSILAPNSSREFTFPRSTQTTQNKQTQSAPQPANTASLMNREYPVSLYSLRKTSGGWTLSLKKQNDFSSAVLMSPVHTTGQGVAALALRSAQAIGNTNEAKLFHGTELLGAEEGFHFLASSSFVDDAREGSVLRIEIPSRAIYGSNFAGGLYEYPCEEGGAILVRLYGLRYAHPMAKFVTYRIPLTAAIPGAKEAGASETSTNEKPAS